MTYINNDFVQFFKELFDEKKKQIGSDIATGWIKVIVAFLAAIIRLLKLVLLDAGIEIIFILLFGKVVLAMAQGRDLIVSMFEPDGLYDEARVFYTILSLFAFSMSMWIIPAFLFELKKKFIPKGSVEPDPFEKHLFFAHRVLPLIPFWFMAYGLFNYNGMLFVSIAVLELILLSIYSYSSNKKKLSRIIVISVLVLLGCFLWYFLRNFQVKYLSVKQALAVILYLLSVLLYMFYHTMDTKIIRDHINQSNLVLAKRHKVNTIMYSSFLFIHIVLVILFITQYFGMALAPDSMLLYVFSLYVFIIDLIFYIIKLKLVYKIGATILAVALVICIFSGKIKFNTNQYTVDRMELGQELSGHKIQTLEQYYNQWKKRMRMEASQDTFPIILVAGEGGGSRAGFWFSQNMIGLDQATNGKFRNHIFSISTVSGSTVGLSTYFAYLDHVPPGEENKNIPETVLDLPGEVYKTNFVGSSISGLFIVDLFHAIVPGKGTNDRNNVLMKQEEDATVNALLKIGIKDVLHTALDQEYMSVFYDKDSAYRVFREDHPLALINTTRSDDGRRGIYAPIRIDSTIFYDAIDINRYLYMDTVWGKRKTRVRNTQGIKFGVACVSSELFPILSAPIYIDSLGSFVDGGYHENSGLKTTLDLYYQLLKMMANDPDMAKLKYKIYIVYLKNGGSGEDLYSPKPSVLPILQPLNTLIGQPFNGSASYFEQKAIFTGGEPNKTDFIRIALDSHLFDISRAESDVDEQIFEDLRVKPRRDSTIRVRDTVMNFPLARWLSRSVIRQMRKNQERIQKDTSIPLHSMVNFIKDYGKK